ncbi:MAG: WD40 repeat domain-containing protein [Candidatus Babeliales bacterium]
MLFLIVFGNSLQAMELAKPFNNECVVSGSYIDSLYNHKLYKPNAEKAIIKFEKNNLGYTQYGIYDKKFIQDNFSVLEMLFNHSKNPSINFLNLLPEYKFGKSIKKSDFDKLNQIINYTSETRKSKLSKYCGDYLNKLLVMFNYLNSDFANDNPVKKDLIHALTKKIKKGYNPEYLDITLETEIAKNIILSVKNKLLRYCTKPVHTLNSHAKLIRFNHDDSILVAALKENIILWDTKTGKRLHTLNGHTSRVSSVCFNHDGSILAAGSKFNTILWDAKTGKRLHMLNDHSSYVTSVCFNHDGTIFASASCNETVLWDTKTGQQLYKLKNYNHNIILNNFKHASYVTSACLNHDGSILASASRDSTIILRDVKTGKRLHALEYLNDYLDQVKSICFNHDSTIISASGGKEVILWDTKTGKQLHRLNGHTSRVTSVCFNHNGSILASASKDKTVTLWDAKTGQQLHTLNGHTDWVNSICFNHNSTIFVSASDDKTIILWDMNFSKKLAEICSLPQAQLIYAACQNNGLTIEHNDTDLLEIYNSFSPDIQEQLSSLIKVKKNLCKIGVKIGLTCFAGYAFWLGYKYFTH